MNEKQIPKRLYHFINKKWGLDDLKKRHLKIARIEQLNDPFEFLGGDLSDKKLRGTMVSMKKTMSKNTGLLCFSENWQNPVQWAHYADGHKGLCLGFDVIDEFLSAVSYEKDRFLALDNEPETSFLVRSIFSKFSHWNYEEEYRVFKTLTNKIDDHYFSNFSENTKLKEVIVGCKSDITRSDISLALGNMQKDVEVFKARPTFRSFNIVRNKDESLWK